MSRVLIDFIEESNRIEGILRPPTRQEIDAHKEFLKLGIIRIVDIENFVYEVSAAKIRKNIGMNVIVGTHKPPPGGPKIIDNLQAFLRRINHPIMENPYDCHCEYESLHAFMDGNGRSGRVIWAWMKKREGYDPFHLGFLHSFYYEALSNSRI